MLHTNYRRQGRAGRNLVPPAIAVKRAKKGMERRWEGEEGEEKEGGINRVSTYWSPTRLCRRRHRSNPGHVKIDVKGPFHKSKQG